MEQEFHPKRPTTLEAEGCQVALGRQGELISLPVVIQLPIVSRHVLLRESKALVAESLIAAAKRQIMASPLDKNELSALLDTARKAGFAEGYAQAKLEAALERVTETPTATKEVAKKPISDAEPPSFPLMGPEVAKPPETGGYVTRTTVTATRAIALDYLKSVAPRIVGPTEIIKNSKKTLGVSISFGTLNRAIEPLVEAGDVEQTERSRWRYKARADTGGLRSVK